MYRKCMSHRSNSTPLQDSGRVRKQLYKMKRVQTTRVIARERKKTLSGTCRRIVWRHNIGTYCTMCIRYFSAVVELGQEKQLMSVVSLQHYYESIIHVLYVTEIREVNGDDGGQRKLIRGQLTWRRRQTTRGTSRVKPVGSSNTRGGMGQSRNKGHRDRIRFLRRFDRSHATTRVLALA